MPYPAFLEPAIRARLRGQSFDELVFGNGADHLRLRNSEDGWFATAAIRRNDSHAIRVISYLDASDSEEAGPKEPPQDFGRDEFDEVSKRIADQRSN